jgi:DNA-binding response OmpR family regulator
MLRQILIVDDDEDDCNLFCEAVKMVDSKVVCQTVHSTRSALKLLDSDYTPDYIFLDLNMPGLDGSKCLSEIRKIQSLLTIPVIIYTTSKREDDRVRTKNLGANYFMTKPSSLAELCGEISFVFLTSWDKKPIYS